MQHSLLYAVNAQTKLANEPRNIFSWDCIVQRFDEYEMPHKCGTLCGTIKLDLGLTITGFCSK